MSIEGTEKVDDPAAAARQAIVAWSATQETWKQDALRRVLRRSHSAEDVEKVYGFLVQIHSGEELDGAIECSENDVIPTLLEGGISAITSIKNVEHVNRLAQGQRIDCSPTGVTAIYGHNGSGKSGYSRILKRACGARDQEPILPNVFSAQPSRPASAEFEALENGSSQTVVWNDASDPPPELACVAVFDSKCAPLYVEKKGGLRFIPYGLDCFERLAALLDAVATDAAQRLAHIHAQCETPLFPGNTSPSLLKLKERLGTLPDDEFHKIMEWDDQHTTELTSLQGIFRDPAAQAKKLQSLASSLWEACDQIETGLLRVSPTSRAGLRERLARRKSLLDAQSALATDRFSGEPVAGTGSDHWKALYLAAREFSVQLAFPDQPFPSEAADSTCVLCQQPLNDEARARFKRFDDFISDRVVEDLRLLEHSLGESRDELVTLSVAISGLQRPPFEAPSDNTDGAQFDALQNSVLEGLSRMIQWIDGESSEDIAEPDQAQMANLRKVISRLQSDAQLAEDAANKGTTSTAAERLDHIHTKKLMCDASEVVRTRRALLQTIKRLEAIKNSCATASITKTGGDLLKRFVTDQLESAFLEEKRHLSLAELEVTLKTTARKGMIDRAVGIDAEVKASVHQVLSEGEHRATALAAFFAELRVSANRSPIVIDDPVSSLDHRRRERVAKRIAELGADRQVIVLTHDLPFFLSLEESCEQASVGFKRLHIERSAEGFGTLSEEDSPWDARKFKQRRHTLSQIAAEAKAHWTTIGENEAYCDIVTRFYDRLRKTWERALEELVFRDSINRFRISLQTLRLNKVVFDDEIFNAYYNGMTEASKFTGHDQATALGGACPEPDKLFALLEDLEAFERLLGSKGEEAAKRREQ